MRVEGKVAVVTGGAAGMGRSHARLLGHEGASVVVTDIDVRGGRETVELIEADGGTASFVQHDVSSAEGWKVVVEHAVERHLRGMRQRGIDGTQLSAGHGVVKANTAGFWVGGRPRSVRGLPLPELPELDSDRTAPEFEHVHREPAQHQKTRKPN